jgi:hypothetical protein
MKLIISQPPHELLVLLQPIWGQQPTQQPARIRMGGRSIVTMCSYIGSWLR